MGEVNGLTTEVLAHYPPGAVAFSVLLRRARDAKGWTYRQAAREVTARCPLDDEGPCHQWLAHLESNQARPLSNVLRVDAVLDAYGLTWADALRALGVNTKWS